MTLPELYWLPVAEEFQNSLSEIRRKATDQAGIATNLQRLANSQIDFLQTIKLDRVLQAMLSRIGPAFDDLPRLKLGILGSNTLDHLLPSIRIAGLRRGLIIEVYVAPFGGYIQEILNPSSGLWAFEPDAVLFSLDAAAVLPQLPLAADRPTCDAEIDERIGQLVQLWQRIETDLKAVVIQQTVLGNMSPIFGEFDAQVPAAPLSLLRSLNHGIADQAVAHKALLIDLDWWGSQFGLRQICDKKLWHHAKQEIAPPYAPFYGELVARILASIKGLSRKSLVLDLDNTIWGGVVGDDGLEGITLGQGSALGEAYAAFQLYVKRLAERGVILAICSKNEAKIVHRVFDEHPEMILQRSDIAVIEASWNDKASGLCRISEELNIGLDSLVFFDDNPAERAIVRETLPAIAVPEVPEAPEVYVDCLVDSGYFEVISFTDDDSKRTRQYASNRQRIELRNASVDMDSFLRSLEMHIEFGPFDTINLSRIVQLINKTNQFNLTTRRYTEAEVSEIMKDPGIVTLQARLWDRFGDNGIITAIICRLQHVDGECVMNIDTWLMSCRVLGRRVEYAVLERLTEIAKTVGAQALLGRYVPTERNALVRDHYPNLGFEQLECKRRSSVEGEFHWIYRIGESKIVATNIFKVTRKNGTAGNLRDPEQHIS